MSTLKQLFEGVEGMDESLLGKLTPIFEAKVSDRVEERTAQLNEAHEAEKLELQTQLDEALAYNINEANADMAKKLDTFLENVVVQWANENSVPLQEGAVVDAASNFFESLNEAASNMNIKLPEKDEMLELESLKMKTESYRDRLNDTLGKVAELSESLEGFQRDKIVSEVGEGMSMVGKQRLAEKCQALNFQDDGNFKSLVEAQKFIIEKEHEDEDPKLEGEEYKSKVGKKEPAKKPMNESVDDDTPVDLRLFR